MCFQTFEINLEFDDYETVWDYDIELDGVVCSQELKQDRKFVTSKGVQVSATHIQKYVFSLVKLTGKSGPICNQCFYSNTFIDDDAIGVDAQGLSDLGSIVVKLWRSVYLGKDDDSNVRSRKSLLGEGLIHEKSKKVVSHRIG